MCMVCDLIETNAPATTRDTVLHACYVLDVAYRLIQKAALDDSGFFDAYAEDLVRLYALHENLEQTGKLPVREVLDIATPTFEAMLEVTGKRTKTARPASKGMH